MKLGFIGAGNMATAIITGIVTSGVCDAGDVSAYDIDAEKTDGLSKKLGIVKRDGAIDMAKDSDMVIVAIKPIFVRQALSELSAHLKGKAVISIAAGWTSAALKGILDQSTRLLRVMPNTPALCLNGMTALSRDTTLTAEEARFAEKVFGSFGLFEWVREDQMDAVIGVSGSSPAYVYMFIEALADAGVALGLARNQAVMMAAQAVKGSAEMVLSTNRHPGELKDMVCSPGGTTIDAVRVLEERGMRAAVMNAAIEAAEKSKRL